MVFLAASFYLTLSLSVWYLAIYVELMCNLIWCYVDMLVCFAWIVAQLLGQRPGHLAEVRHISVLNKSLPRFPLFDCQRMCKFVYSRDGGCREGVLFVQLDAFMLLLCQVCVESRDIVISASPWNVLSGCRMNNLHIAIVVVRGCIRVSNGCY